MFPQNPRIVSLAEIVEGARLFVAEMPTYGIRVPVKSRVRQYLEALEEWLECVESKPGHRDGETIQRFIFAYQEIFLLARIFDELKRPPEVEGWQKRFRKILKGPFFPGDEDDWRRDIQAELQFAAIAKQRGFQPELGFNKNEPDVILCYGTDWLAVEAKRPHSVDRIKDRVRVAADQIARRGLNGGLIFLDLSIALAKVKREILSPQAKVAEPWHIERPDQLPGFKMRLGHHLLDILSLHKSYIPQNSAPQVFGMSALSIETVFFGPVTPYLPPAATLGGLSHYALSHFGGRFYSDFRVGFQT